MTSEDSEQSTIPTHYEIAFDPAKLKEDLLKLIWSDDIARLLWCAVKYGHVTSQHFNEDVLRAARRIRACNGSLSVEQLREILLNSSDPAFANPWQGQSNQRKMLAQLIHLIKERQPLTFTITKPNKS